MKTKLRKSSIITAKRDDSGNTKLVMTELEEGDEE